MKFEDFRESLIVKPISITVDDFLSVKNNSLDNEALFQLPFIAMTILVMVKGLIKPSVSELGRLVGECLEQSMPAFKKSKQHISWSANLRVRTVKAFSFLEVTELVVVVNNKITVTKLGKKVISRALESESDLSDSLHNIYRQFRHINKDNKLELRLK